MPGAGSPEQEREGKRHGGAGSCSSRQSGVTTAWSRVRVNLEEAKGGGETVAGGTAALAPLFPPLLERTNELQATSPALRRPTNGLQDLALTARPFTSGPLLLALDYPANSASS